MITILSNQSSVVSQYLRELRDKGLQTDRERFGRNLEKLGMVMGYEISKLLHYKDHATQTPLGTANTPLINDQLVIATVLRAGLPLQQGLHNILTSADLAFVGAGRKADTAANGVEIDLGYAAAPDLNGKVLILADTMLATGSSLLEAYQALTMQHGTPKQVYLAAVIASQPGVDFVTKHIPEASLMVCTVDADLNSEFFIVPGLGDAGDLLYGPKL